MLKQVKETNEKAIENYLGQAFGEGYEVKANWGYPVTSVLLTNKTESRTTSWRVSVNLDNEKYEVSTFASETTKEDDNEVVKPSWATINDDTINFIKDGISKVINAIFGSGDEENETREEQVDAEQVE